MTEDKFKQSLKNTVLSYVAGAMILTGAATSSYEMNILDTFPKRPEIPKNVLEYYYLDGEINMLTGYSSTVFDSTKHASMMKERENLLAKKDSMEHSGVLVEKSCIEARLDSYNIYDNKISELKALMYLTSWPFIILGLGDILIASIFRKKEREEYYRNKSKVKQ